jgi:hypothetical protein
MVKESQRKANKKWDSENMLTLSVRLRKEQVEEFRRAAESRGATANALLKQFVLETIKSPV